MGLALGLAACFALWWLSQNRGRLGTVLAGLPRQRLAGWAALAAALVLLLHGNLIVAAVLGLGGLWSLEGPGGLGRRLRGLLPAGVAATRHLRTRTVTVSVRGDGSFVGGRVATGPLAGAWLDGLDIPTLAALQGECRAQDPEGAALLEAYLDRRAPGWRVDAQRDRDPGPGRPAKPGAMTHEEAYEILGLERGAPAEQIRSAHRALMKRLHPDQGGTAEGAARVNAARDRLLNRHR